MNEKVIAEYEKALKKSNELKSQIKVCENQLKALEAKEKLLTQKSRSKFIFSLGLRAEPYFKEPEFLTEYDLDMIMITAMSEPDICDLIERITEKRKAEFYEKDGVTTDQP